MDRQYSPDRLKAAFEPLASAYTRLSDSFDALSEHDSRSEIDWLEANDAGLDVGQLYDLNDSQNTQRQELVEDARKGVIGLAGAQAIIEPQMDALPEGALCRIIVQAGDYSRILTEHADEAAFSRLREKDLLGLSRSTRTLANDLSALIALTQLQRIPVSAFSTVGDRRGALVPLVEGIERNLLSLVEESRRLFGIPDHRAAPQRDD